MLSSVNVPIEVFCSSFGSNCQIYFEVQSRGNNFNNSVILNITFFLVLHLNLAYLFIMATNDNTVPSSEEVAAAAVDIAKLNKEAGQCKRLITIKTQSVLTSATISIPLVKNLIPVIQEKIDALSKIHASKLNSLDILVAGGKYTQLEYDHLLAQDEKSELNCREILVNILEKVKESEAASSANTSHTSDAASVPQVTPLIFRPPTLEISPFSGNQNNDFEFINFKTSFFNALEVSPPMTEKQKFLYLKTLLRGRALSLLQQCDSTMDQGLFDTAWRLLEKEYLKVDLLIESSIAKIKDHPALNSLDEIVEFLTFLRFKEVNLASLGVKLPTDDHLDFSNRLLSAIVRDKLPNYFLVELARKTDNPIPSFRLLLEHGDELVCRLRNTRKPSSNAKPTEGHSASGSSSGAASGNRSTRSHLVNINQKGSAGPKGQSSSSVVGRDERGPVSAKGKSFLCKFCESTDHSSLKCTKIPSYNARIAVAKRKNLCTRCLSPQHGEGECPGVGGRLPFDCSLCKSRSHVSPLCKSLHK